MEKERNMAKQETAELKSEVEAANRSRANTERVVKDMEFQLNEYNSKIDHFNVMILELTSQNSRLQQDKMHLEMELEDAQNMSSGTQKIKQQFQYKIDEATRNYEEEVRVRISISQHLKAVTEDYESIKTQYEEEISNQNDLRSKLNKAVADSLMWKSKYESEGLVRAEELEDAKKKLAMKLMDAEEQVEQALMKCASLEKSKNKLQYDMEDLLVDVEKANATSSSLEKKTRQFDKMIEDWKMKCESK